MTKKATKPNAVARIEVRNTGRAGCVGSSIRAADPRVAAAARDGAAALERDFMVSFSAGVESP
jgi:hypothetical protein